MSEAYLPVYLDYAKPEAGLALAGIWERLCAEKLAGRLFYDGLISDFDAFRAKMFRPGCLPFAVYENGRLAMFSWLNRIEGKAARTHFAVFREFQGREKRAPLCRFLCAYLLSLRDERGFLFDCLYGITPATYSLALRAALDSGWKKCGVIPKICFIAALNEYVDGALTCATREILRCH